MYLVKVMSLSEGDFLGNFKHGLHRFDSPRRSSFPTIEIPCFYRILDDGYLCQTVSMAVTISLLFQSMGLWVTPTNRYGYKSIYSTIRFFYFYNHNPFLLKHYHPQS